MVPDSGKRLSRSFFERPTAQVAIDLLSTTLWRMSDEGVVAGRVVETEAYLDAKDRASHAAWSKRGRDVMERAPGTVYIYRSYGIHWMFNVVAHEPGGIGAILFRAVEPLIGTELMEQRRGVFNLRQLCSGPGKLCQAFSIDESLHKVDLATSDEVWLGPPDSQPTDGVLVGERIGITKSPELQLRYFMAGNPFVSAHRRGVPLTAEVLPSN